MPKHRGTAPEPAYTRTVRRSAAYSGIAVAATGIAVTGGLAAKDRAPADSAAATIAAAQTERSADRADSSLADRADSATRSASRSDRRDRRDRRDRGEQERARQEATGGQATRPGAMSAQDMSPEDARVVARRLMSEYGLSPSEFGCLDALWISESDWEHTADNPTSTAYGIPQALTGGTHDTLPADYMTNPVSQIRWGLWYIRVSYGTACSAWEFKQANNWY